MSMKSDKSDGKPAHISIPQKDAIAIVPPKKVRRVVPGLLKGGLSWDGKWVLTG